MREAALHARRLAGLGHLAPLLTELGAGDRPQRRMALHLALSAHDVAYVERVLAGPDMPLRRSALRGIRTLPVSDAAAARVLEDAPADLRAAWYRVLRAARRTALADRLLPAVAAAWGDREAAVLLPACSSDTVAEWLPRLRHAVAAWRALAKAHPDAVLADAEAVSAAGAGAGASRWLHGPGRQVLDVLAPIAPARVLALVERHRLWDMYGRLPDGRALRALLAFDAARTVAALRPAPGSIVRYAELRPVRERLADLPDDVVAPMVRFGGASTRALMAALPPARRATVYDLVVGSGERTSFGFDTALLHLDLLPADRAAAEARAWLAWHAERGHSSGDPLDDPEFPLRLTVCLPYAEAAPELRKAAFGTDADLRALARGLLVSAAARSGNPMELRDVLAELSKRSTAERDPVRCALVEAIEELPVGALDEQSAPVLGELSGSTISALDCGPATAVALRRLAGRVLHHYPASAYPALTAWALDVFARLVDRFGAAGISLPAPAPRGRQHRMAAGAGRPSGLDTRLRHGQEHALYAILAPRLAAHAARGDHTLAVALAAVLRRRAWALDGLQQDLRRAAESAEDPSVAARARTLWLDNPATRDTRAVELARAVPDSREDPAVAHVLLARRTDAAAELLGGNGETDGWTPTVTGVEAGRWTPALTARITDALAAVLTDPAADPGDRADAAASLGRVPGTVAVLAEQAAGADVFLAESALRALGRAGRNGDAEEAFGVLSDYARGAASRVAVHALARCAGSLPPSRLSPALTAALTGPDGKVVMRKEAARLLARHRLPGAVDALLGAWADPATHRDVRVAVADALRRFPDDPRVFPALEEAAGRYTGDAMQRTLFQATPAEYAAEVRPRYARLVRALADAADHAGVVWRAGLAVSDWLPWLDIDYPALADAYCDPADPKADLTSRVLQRLTASTTDYADPLRLLARLLDADTPAAPHDDRSELRVRAHVLVGWLEKEYQGVASAEAARVRRRALEDAVALLAAHPLHLGRAVSCAAQLLPRALWEPAEPLDTAVFTARCAALADLVADHPVQAGRAAREVTRQVHRNWGEPLVPSAALAAAARHSADRGDLAGGLLAVALVNAGGAQDKWTASWRTLTVELRESADAEVAQAAWGVSME